MGGFGPGGGVSGGGYVGPKPDDEVEAALAAEGQKLSGLLERFWAAYHASRAKGHGYFVSVLAPIFEATLAGVVELITSLQSKDNPEFYTLVAGFMSDLLGVEVSAAVMRNAFIRGGDVGGARAVGAALLKQLAGEFGSTLQFGTDKRLDPALTFLGFLISFSIRVGNMTFITGAIPYHDLAHLDDIREYGEQMASNLGLGRLARRALGPFIDDLVGKPMQDAIRSQLRPTDLAAPEAVRAFTRGLIDEATFRKTMSNLGYPDELTQALVVEYLARLNPDEILTLLRWGVIDQGAALERFKLFGYDTDTAAAVTDAHNRQRADGAISDYLTNLRDQLKGRFIDTATFDKLVDQLPIPDVVKDWQRRIGGQIAETPSRRLTLAEMTRYYAEGLVDLDDFTTWAASAGYSENETQLLVLDLLLRSPFTEDKLRSERLKVELQYRLLVKKALKAGLPPPPAPVFP